MITNKLNIRAFTAQEWNTYKTLRLRALADSPDAFGATLASEQKRSDVEWSRRLSFGASSDWDMPLVAEIDGLPVGLAWGRIEESDREVANLYQMWVDPAYRRLGVGQMLLEAVIAWARAKNASFLDLGVTFSDSPAMRLYRRAGFMPAGDPQPLRSGSKLLGLPMRLNLRSS